MSFEGDLESFLLWALQDREAPTFGLFDAPNMSGFCLFDEGKPVSPHQGIDFDWIYSMRVCHPDYEGRWQWCGDHGTGQILDDAGAEARGWRRLESEVPNRRLLRGTAREVCDGWTRMADGQSRPYWIPVVLDQHEYGFVDVIEYIECETQHGNCGVVAERWIAITGQVKQ